LKILWKIQSADKLCSQGKGEARDDSSKHSVCLLRLLGSGRASGAERKSNSGNFLASLSVSTTAIAYQREESRGDQANCFLSGEKKSRIVLDSARVAHKYRGQFYAVAARLERQRKKKRQIAVSSGLRRAIVRNNHAGDLLGRM